MSYLFLRDAVDDLRGDRVPHVSGQQRSRVVLGLNAGRAHLLPPGGHGLRVPRLVYGHWRKGERDTQPGSLGRSNQPGNQRL